MIRDVFVIINGTLITYNGAGGDVVIPEGVTAIGEFAFAFCEEMKHITIPDSVQRIGRGAFKGCKGLADANGFVVVRHMLHDYCGQEENVVIPEGVRTIGYEAFRGNKTLRDLTIPEYVTAISSSAFERCPNLTLLGPAGGCAEIHAKQRGIPFETIQI